MTGRSAGTRDFLTERAYALSSFALTCVALSAPAILGVGVADLDAQQLPDHVVVALPGPVAPLRDGRHAGRPLAARPEGPGPQDQQLVGGLHEGGGQLLL